MKIYLEQNVFDAALSRINRLYDEFPQVVVSFSGGKDSTVLLQLALRVATERGRLPLNVFWLDQEAEWDVVVRYVRSIMNRPDVKPYWFQGPFKLSNSTTTGDDAWLHCWREGDEWIRPKEPNSIHVNKLGKDRFREIFDVFLAYYFGDAPVANLGGVRCEESPSRLTALTNSSCYKDITWGKKVNVKLGHYTFYPLYDWGYKDIWKAIHDNGWPYCALYDLMYQQGVHVKDMRVSNVHHETSLDALRFLAEIEPDLWNRLTERVQGANSVARARELYRCPEKLPFMFASWREYRDHLLQNIVEGEDARKKFIRQFEGADRRFAWETDKKIEDSLMRVCVSALLVNDYDGAMLHAFDTSHMIYTRSYIRKHADDRPRGTD